MLSTQQSSKEIGRWPASSLRCQAHALCCTPSVVSCAVQPWDPVTGMLSKHEVCGGCQGRQADGAWPVQGLVKRFFNEKEVTSTLVMDALFSGCKQLEEVSCAADSKKARSACHTRLGQ